MDGLKNFVNKNKKLVTYYIFGCCILSGLNCLERADYNFLLIFFMYYTMFMEHKNTPIQEKELKKERLCLLVTIAGSYVIDFLWISFYQQIGFGLSMFLSYLELVTKIPIAVIAFVKYLEVTKNSFAQDFQEFKEDLPY